MKASERAKKLPGSLRSDKGIVLPVGLILLAVLLVIGMAAVKSSSVGLKTTSNYKTGNAALNLAEAGAEYMRKRLDQNDDVDGANGPDKTQVFTNNLAINNWNSSLVLAALQSGATGTIGVVRDSVDTSKATITSKATLAGSTQTVTLVVKLPGPDVAALPAALTSVSNGDNYLHSEDSSVATGNEESPPGTCTNQTNKPGWVANATHTLDSDGSGTVSGNPQQRAWAQADGAIFNDPAGLRAWVNSLGSQPGVVNVNGTAGHPTTMGTAANPQITVWNLTGNGANSTNAPITGYGILIIKGDASVQNGKQNWFTFNDAFNFNGLVIVDSPGRVHFSYDAFTHGAMIAVSERTGAEATSIEFEENGKLSYNCDSLKKYAAPLTISASSLATLSWRHN